ncbi:MAG: 4Fe-4S binding protein [Halanaerobiales bacterium]
MSIDNMSEKLIFKVERCKGCKLCINVCPVSILEMSDQINHKGYHPVKVFDIEKCISCGLCALVCPDLVIEVYKEE